MKGKHELGMLATAARAYALEVHLDLTVRDGLIEGNTERGGHLATILKCKNYQQSDDPQN